MNELLKKMNYKNQQRLLVLNAPEEFHPHLQAFREAAEVDETIGNQRGSSTASCLSLPKTAGTLWPWRRRR